eukprot:TRINITY_DN1413_c0_g1_i2.p5 TRINITY_DN1413_c0_g1~~TRINITY_DN1413_c0_g1_i2.p5  ORF type:complete len:153 (+),score=3.51 TRINITY_DN1413_c0_g1_i2:464-922(+)
MLNKLIITTIIVLLYNHFGCFGFTKVEVESLLLCYFSQNVPKDNLIRNELNDWYNGYLVNMKKKLYCPSSVLQHANANLNESEIAAHFYWAVSEKYIDLYSKFKEAKQETSFKNFVKTVIIYLISEKGIPFHLKEKWSRRRSSKTLIIFQLS